MPASKLTPEDPRSTMTMTVNREADASAADRQYKAEVRRMWAMGDYGRFAELVWEVGPVLVAAARVRPGQRVLDVAAGTGNAAIRAAEAGARVVASDLTPENFEAGRRNAQRHGVQLEWVEADAEALPFEEAEFDVAMSCFGALFAPRHQRVADELVRVCKPGGTIAMANFTPEGLLTRFFEVFIPYMPPPRPGDLPPVLWGSEDHVRELFGGKVSSLEMSRRTYVERAASPRAYCEFFKETFGPVAAIYSGLANKPRDRAALDRAFLDFAEQSNQGRPGGPAEYVYEYLLVVARK
jgi:ubiquinone/menaquinone biosynthesis C-methylase UbiE